MTTLSLEASKAIYDLVGEYETELTEEWICSCADDGYGSCGPTIPLPNFAEVVRIMPRIGRAKKKILAPWIIDLADKYMFAPTEEKGMAAVEKYLLSLLKIV